MPWTALIDTCLDDLNLILRGMIRAGYNELPPPVISGQIHHYNGVCKIGVSTDCDAIVWTLHDCLSQMNENLLISNSKLTSDSELIWWR